METTIFEIKEHYTVDEIGFIYASNENDGMRL